MPSWPNLGSRSLGTAPAALPPSAIAQTVSAKSAKRPVRLIGFELSPTEDVVAKKHSGPMRFSVIPTDSWPASGTRARAALENGPVHLEDLSVIPVHVDSVRAGDVPDVLRI